MGSLGPVADLGKDLGAFFGYFEGISKALSYFLEGDFDEAFAAGFMR